MYKKVSLILILALFTVPACIAMAETNTTVMTDGQYSIKVQNHYNAFGIAVSSTQISTQKITTEDDDGNVTTTVTTTTTHSSYHNGTLKTDSIETTSQSTDGEGNVTAISHYTDTYTYDAQGFLVAVEGHGESVNYTYGYSLSMATLKDALGLSDDQIKDLWNRLVDKGYITKDGVLREDFLKLKSASDLDLGDLSPDVFNKESIYNALNNQKSFGVTRMQVGEINRVFEVRDGQAVLVKVETTGQIFGRGVNAELDSDGNVVKVVNADGTPALIIGEFANTTTIDYAYLGGNWVSTKQVARSESNVYQQYEESMVKITTYDRDQNTGAITNMSQTIDESQCSRIQYTSSNSQITYSILPGSYQTTVAHDAQQGYYVSSESYEWVATAHDTTQNNNGNNNNGGGNNTNSLESAISSWIQPNSYYGDLSAESLMAGLWDAVSANDTEKMKAYAAKIISLFGDDAEQQGQGLTNFPDTNDPNFWDSYWALNYVGAAYLYLGEALMAEGNNDLAKEAFLEIKNSSLQFAQVLNQWGGYWHVVDKANSDLNAL